MKLTLNIERLCAEAVQFTEIESIYDEPTLYGVTDGKAVGTYLEHKFTAYLAENYNYQPGNSASGIDIPNLEVGIKVTSIKRPQSSCPFKSASQKVFGLGYHLLVFVYDKYDDPHNKTGRLDIQQTVFIDKSRTADFQTTRGILDILNRDGNKDDILAFLEDRNLPVDEIGVNQLADRILESPPHQGYLTISNALQWRLQYGRVIQQVGNVSGIIRVR
ncbi:MAG: restriction endonuclease [Cylindrospermopsis raciborskii KL1]|uniref:restriction endonuclease n=1 Tax=Cylindrospermopsis raciborskii TaxID=77022 RepID=UPI001A34B1B5|nr:restriction endonuclease [Cylindrospermopsis raciborskii]MBG0744926.1 restriction endonuclease [Cylindrospermopsis raciborskii KL1]